MSGFRSFFDTPEGQRLMGNDNVIPFRRPASEQLGVDNPPKPEVVKCLGCGWEDFKVLTNGVLICSHCARRPGALLPRMEDFMLIDP